MRMVPGLSELGLIVAQHWIRKGGIRTETSSDCSEVSYLVSSSAFAGDKNAQGP